MYLLPCQEENNNQWDGERFSRPKKEKRQQQSQPNKFAEQIIDSHLDGTADQSPHFILAARKRQNKRGVVPLEKMEFFTRARNIIFCTQELL